MLTNEADVEDETSRVNCSGLELQMSRINV